jgi:hypothetical protein
MAVVVEADYILEYQIEEDSQKFMYKNSTTAKLENLSQDDKSTIYKIDKKSYIVTYDRGEAKIVDVEQIKAMANSFGFDASEHMHEEETPQSIKIKKTGKRLKVAGINGEVWSVIAYENGLKQTSEVVVTNDKRVLTSVRAMEKLFGSMSGAEHEESGLEIQKGYVIIQAEGMRLTSFKEAKVSADEYKLPKNASQQDMSIGSGVSDTLVKDCYTKVCCGSVSGKSEVLSKSLTPNYKGYKLAGSGVCDAMGISSALGINSIEGALYTKGSDNVQITLNLDDADAGTVQKTKKNLDDGYGVVVSQIKDYESYSKAGLKYYYGVLMPMNQETLDIIINDTTTLTLSRIKKANALDLKTFANAIDISALKESAKNSPKKSATSEIDAHKAINMLKSFF